MDSFEALGIQIGDQWNSADSADQLIKIAEEALREAPLGEIGIDFILAWANERALLPKQLNFQTQFGEPPLTVYAGDGFYLEVLFWFTSRTAIHGHGFTGAFRVLSGHSLQTEYDFVERDAICEGVSVGSLSLRNLRLIGPGDVAPILSGDEFIHCVAHLGRPSITLVARTTESRGVRQYSYSRSGLAWLPFHRKEDISRRVALVGTLERVEKSRYREEMRKMVSGGDPHRCLMTMLALNHSHAGDDWLDEIAEIGCPDADQRQHLREAVHEIARQKRIWNAIGDFPELQRLRIALGELFGTEAQALQEIGTYYPDHPAEDTLARWEKEILL